MGFGSSFKKAGFGGNRDGGNQDWKNNDKGGYQPNGGDNPADDPMKKMMPRNEEGGDEEKKEMKPETPKEEGDEHETIEAVLDLFDQMTPLIEKLRAK